MKTASALELVPTGTLPRPGPIGRFVRAALGAFCLWALAELIRTWPITAAQPFTTLDNRLLMLAAPLCLVNYVVNIGLSVDRGHWPLALSVTGLALCATLAYAIDGRLDSALLGQPLNLWLGWFYAHLGGSFLLAAALGTPGCEMRALPDLLGRLRGAPSREHRCPAAFIERLDAWERERRRAT